MGFRKFSAIVLVLAAAASYPLAAQQPIVTIEGDNIAITGCFARVTASPSMAPTSLLWSKGDLMLASAAAAGANVAVPVGTSGVSDRVFYWLNNEDDMAKYLGQRVRITGEVDDFQKGEIEIDRDGDYANVKLEIDKQDEDIRIPMAFLGRGIRDDVNIDIVARKVDVDDVDVLGPCVP
jgi:hypothetical protein